MKQQAKVTMADRILAGCDLFSLPNTAGYEVIQNLRQDIGECEIIDATDAANYYHASVAASGKAPIDAFPNIAPPFQKFFIEMKSPQETGCERTGVLFESERISSQQFEDEYRDTIAAKQGVTFEWTPDTVMTGEDVWVIRATALGYVNRRVIPILYTIAIVSMRGQLATRYNPCWSLADRQIMSDAALEEFTRQIIYPAYFALSFLHCKNVILRTNEPPTAFDKSYQRRHGRPLLRYHTLEIEPMKRVLETEGGLGHNGLKKALHLCRGHFVTYTSERPLFGKITGTFWKDAHVRGDAREGIVAKDYKIKKLAVSA